MFTICRYSSSFNGNNTLFLLILTKANFFFHLKQVLKPSALDYIKGFDSSSCVSVCVDFSSSCNLLLFSLSLVVHLDQFLFFWALQTLLQKEELQQQLSIGVQPEPYNSIFKAAAVKNVIPDPDIPNRHDSSLPEYGWFMT